MIRISAVSYLNTKPFIYGILRSELSDAIELSLDIPSVCAQKLKEGKADLVLTPVAIIPELEEAYLVSDYCIGAQGKVKTVCIYANSPLETIEEIYLDFHSRTSVALTQILCREYWHINPRFLPASEGFEQKISEKTAGLVIGDRTIGLDKQFEYVYDLGEIWTAWTGLPFVFAAWISTKPLEPYFNHRFNTALKNGIEHIPDLTKILPTMPGFDVEDYFKNNISYNLDDHKWLALNKFLTILSGDKGYTLHRKDVAATTF